MRHVQDNAAESVRRVIDRLHDCAFAYEMDQGTCIKVKITVDKDKREATVDFTGTSPQQATNFNAPEPVTRAAVLYVFRVMVDDDIPMNAGCLRPIHIVIPKQSMLSPEYPAAVVAGNVETSQAVTNCLFGALGALAAAQGTMNNLNFGNATLPVLRDDLLRLAGRSGLSRHRRGAHPHDQYAPDRSGGAGVPLSGAAGGFPHPQRLRRTRPMECRRRHRAAPSASWKRWNARSCPATAACAPFGLAGGEAGQVGENAVRRKDGRIEKLKGCDATVLDAGEAIIIQTPTAGGYGKPKG